MNGLCDNEFNSSDIIYQISPISSGVSTNFPKSFPSQLLTGLSKLNENLYEWSPLQQKKSEKILIGGCRGFFAPPGRALKSPRLSSPVLRDILLTNIHPCVFYQAFQTMCQICPWKEERPPFKGQRPTFFIIRIYMKGFLRVFRDNFLCSRSSKGPPSQQVSE